MESSEFYCALDSLPGSYSFDVDGKAITGKTNRGGGRGVTFNPVTAVAYRSTGEVYGTNKRETLRAGKALGLTREFTKFRLAVNDRRMDDTLFINILCFGKMAENLNPMLIKGRLISVTGKLKIDDYVDEKENKKSSVCIMADEISLGPDPSTITPRVSKEEVPSLV